LEDVPGDASKSDSESTKDEINDSFDLKTLDTNSKTVGYAEPSKTELSVVDECDTQPKKLPLKRKLSPMDEDPNECREENSEELIEPPNKKQRTNVMVPNLLVVTVDSIKRAIQSGTYVENVEIKTTNTATKVEKHVETNAPNKPKQILPVTVSSVLHQLAMNKKL